MFSSAAQYAVRATAYLGSLEQDGFVPARSIAGELNIPPTFLSKVLRQLVDAGILSAYRGPTGGVRLARPASQVSVRQIVEAIDGDALFTECILGLPGCGNRKPCPMHEAWAVHRSALAEEFERQTVDTLSTAYTLGDLRLGP
ncbi:MAG: Rrf2 family transcriptional regulator [Rhodothermales bacterium]|nr:Rrf2 family transcriptional regulator [Rhodothermales bacterium]